MFSDVPEMFSVVFRCSFMFSTCYQDVLRIFPWCSEDVLRMFSCYLNDTLVGLIGGVGLVGQMGLLGLVSLVGHRSC